MRDVRPPSCRGGVHRAHERLAALLAAAGSIAALVALASVLPPRSASGPIGETPEGGLAAAAREHEESARDPRDGEGGPTGAAEALRMRALQRSGANPATGSELLRIRNEIERDGSALRGDFWTWTEIGPSNVGGRIRAILPHPANQSVLWIGAASGGIWKTTNGGASFFPIDDFLPSLAVTSLAMDPTNANVMYASTGEGYLKGGQSNVASAGGAGILKSTNQGATWTQLSATANWLYVNRLVHHPTIANLLYAVTDLPRQVVRSTDGGSTWAQLLVPTGTPTSVAIHPTQTGLVFVGCSYNGAATGQVFRSTDGVNFIELTTSNSGDLPDVTGRVEFGMNASSTIYALCDRNGGELWKSLFSGAPGTWQLVATIDLFGVQGFYDNVIWVDPTTATRLVVGGVDLFRSTNSGVNWTKISDGNFTAGLCPHPDQHVLIQQTGWNGSSAQRLYVGNDGGLFRADQIFSATTTSGWTRMNNGLAITQFYGGASSPTGGLILGGTQDNGIPHRNTGGTTWNETTIFLDGGPCAVHHTLPFICYGTTQYGHVWKSTNAAASFADATNGLPYGGGNALFIAPLEIDPNLGSTLWWAGKEICRTTDSAVQWTSRRDSTGAFGSALSVKPGNSNEVWAGYHNGVISRSTDAGATWIDVDDNAPGVPDRWIIDIEASPHRPNEAFVVVGGYASDQVWLTTDGGASWIQRTGSGGTALPPIQVNCITYHPVHPDWIYAGTDLGVFASADRGVSWPITPANGGGNTPGYAEVDDLFWHGDELVAATHGRGMFETRPLPVVYVDLTNSGSEDGSEDHPYNTVGEGIAASGNGTTLSIRNGTYTEGALLFDRSGLVVAKGGTVIVR